MTNPWLLAPGANVLIGVLGMAAAGLTARAIGPAERGVLAGATLWGAILLNGLGMPPLQAMAVFWRDRRAERNATVGAAIVLLLISTIVLVPLSAVLGLAALRRLGAVDAQGALLFFVGSLPLQIVSSAIAGTFLADERHGRFWAVRVFQAAVYCALAAVGAAVGWTSARVFLAVTAASWVIAAAFALVLFAGVHAVGPVRLDRRATAEMASFSWKANASGLPWQVNLRLDQALMVFLASAATNGQYAVAFTWSATVTLVGGGFSSIVLSRARGTSEAETESIFAQIRAIVLVTAALGVGAAAVAPFAVPLLFGASFAPAVPAAVVLCLATLVLNVTQALHELARGTGHPELGIPAEMVAVSLTVVLVSVLVPRWGGLGAAIASTVSYAAAHAVLVYGLSRKLGRPVFARLIPGSADLAAIRTWAARIARSA